MHKEGYCHLDLKLDNILLKRKEEVQQKNILNEKEIEDLEIKIADFGLARRHYVENK